MRAMPLKLRHALAIVAAVTAVVAVVMQGERPGTDDIAPAAAPIEAALPQPEPAPASGPSPEAAASAGVGEATPAGDVTVGDDGVGGLVRDRSPRGALQSVLVFLELGEELIAMTPQDAAATQRLYATEANAEEAAALVAGQVVELQAAAGEGMHLDVAPISWTTTEVVPSSEYVVTVWFVEVFSLGGDADAVAAFKTYSAAVRWENDGWKLDDAEVFPGPQPIAAIEATTGPALRGQIAGFGDGDPLAPIVASGSGGTG